MSDMLLNGRTAEDFEVAHGRECELERDLRQLDGLLAEYPREDVPAPRPVTDVPLGPLP